MKEWTTPSLLAGVVTFTPVKHKTPSTVLAGVGTFAPMKDWLISTVLACIAIFTPIYGIIITVGVLIFADFFSGLLAAFKRGERILSRPMSRMIYKMLAYQTVVGTGYLLQVFILDDIMPVAKLAASVIGLVEFKSILENVESITGQQVFNSLIEKLRSK